MQNNYKNHCRSLLWLSFLGSLFLLSSCGDNEDDVNLAEAIIGTWLQTTYEWRDCDDPADNDSGSCESDCETWVFTTNTITVTEGSFRLTVNYTLSGDQITITNPSNGFTSTSRVSVSGNTMTLVYDNPDDGCTDTYRYSRQ